MTSKLKTIEEIISELGEIPLCQCEAKCGQRVKINPNRYSYYKNHGYPRFLVGHGLNGKKRPEHSEKMKGEKNPMWNNPREDLQEKFKGEGNPMFGEVPWNKNKQWEQEIKDKISESQTEYFEFHPEAKEKLSEIAKLRIGDKNSFYNKQHTNEFKLKKSESQKEFYKLHPEAIKRGEEHWSYGKPSPKLHLFSALDRLVKDKYCPLFTRKLREQVRIRDGYICQLCGKTQEQEGKKLNVHHIHYDKPNCYPDLICLCNICNIRANTNRDYWESFYMNKLNERNLLFWTRNRNKETNI